MPILPDSGRYLRAYYHEFSATGADAIDAVLEAIALAGKAYHQISQWADADEYGPCGYWNLIQTRANDAALAFRPPAFAPAVVRRAMQIADAAMFAALDSYGHATTPDRLVFAPVADGKFVKTIAEAAPEFREAVEWLIAQDYVERLSDAGGEYVVVVRRPA